MVAFGAAVPAVILVLAGCSDATGPSIPGIEVTLTLSDEVMAVGDTIEIRVVATNVTANPVSFRTNACVLVVQILDESNTPVVHLLFDIPRSGGNRNGALVSVRSDGFRQ